MPLRLPCLVSMNLSHNATAIPHVRVAFSEDGTNPFHTCKDARRTPSPNGKSLCVA